MSPVSAADNGGLGCADENASSIPTEYDTDEKDKALKALQEKVSKDAHKALHQPWKRAHVRISAVESACLPRYSSVRPPVDQMKFAFTCMCVFFDEIGGAAHPGRPGSEAATIRERGIGNEVTSEGWGVGW